MVLEANPELTKPVSQLGLHPNWQFVDVYRMDPELLSMIPRPVCALLLLLPITEKYEVFRTGGKKKKISGTECYIISTFQEDNNQHCLWNNWTDPCYCRQ